MKYNVYAPLKLSDITSFHKQCEYAMATERRRKKMTSISIRKYFSRKVNLDDLQREQVVGKQDVYCDAFCWTLDSAIT